MVVMWQWFDQEVNERVGYRRRVQGLYLDCCNATRFCH